MLRLLFEKKGNAVWISHLDLMRVFQRSFQRAGLPLTHTQGFNPRPSVSIALPLSVGIESDCEILDFNLEGEIPAMEEIRHRLNEKLIAGVKVKQVYEEGLKIKHLTYLKSHLNLEYDAGIPEGTEEDIRELFSRTSVIVPKKGKGGKITDQDLIPMIKEISVEAVSDKEIRISLLHCCQNPTLNPMQIPAAIEKELPRRKPDFVTCSREEIYTEENEVFR